jgi:hypothetical protein
MQQASHYFRHPTHSFSSFRGLFYVSFFRWLSLVESNTTVSTDVVPVLFSSVPQLLWAIRLPWRWRQYLRNAASTAYMYSVWRSYHPETGSTLAVLKLSSMWGGLSGGNFKRKVRN